MSKLTILDKTRLIDALEIGEDFITVYCNSNEPGLEDSVQRKLFNELQKLTPIKGYHDPAKFHSVDDPRGSKWRTWERKYACHFHVVYGREVTAKDLDDVLQITEKYNETIST